MVVVMLFLLPERGRGGKGGGRHSSTVESGCFVKAACTATWRAMTPVTPLEHKPTRRHCLRHSNQCTNVCWCQHN